MAKSGIAIAPFMLTGPGGSSGTTGSGGGSTGSGVTSIGFFFRDWGGPGGHGAALARSDRGRDTGSTTGGTSGTTGGGTGSDFYFDEWLQLWVDVEWSETSYATTFYVDEAATIPAGHVTSTYSGDWDVFPQTYRSEYEFSAGPLAGSHGTYDCVQTSLTEGSMIYDNTYVDGSTDHGESEWRDESSRWASRWDGPNHEGWYEDSGVWTSNGTGTYTCSNSEGWSSTWSYNADWSGSAHFEGPDPLLPADMTWTTDGHYRITYADGSSESWSWEDFWGGSEGGGTTGSGGFAQPGG
ncbi:MAG: hypothetical protein H7Y17_10830 [Chlorobia bacterium]|nr:hypothetical protein [Fimbriimonadaceae bacterium]